MRVYRFSLLIILSFNLIGCYSYEKPEIIYHTISSQNKKIFTNQVVWVTNYKIEITYETNSKYTNLPKVEQVFLNTDCGYFGATKVGNKFTIPVTTEEFDNFSISHIQALTDLMASRAAITLNYTSKDYLNLDLVVLGGNNRTNSYKIEIINKPNTSAEYKKWKQLAGGFVARRTYVSPQSASISDNGRTLLLSRGGNNTHFADYYYTYSLCKVLNNGDTALYRNEDTGSYICAKILWHYENGRNIKKLYFVQPYSGKFVIQNETPYNSALDSSILSLLSFRSFLWSRSAMVGVLGLSAELINLLYAGGYNNNEYLSLKDITASGYLMNNFDWDNLNFWGTEF